MQSFMPIHFFVFKIRTIENGFADQKRVRDFRERGPRRVESGITTPGSGITSHGTGVSSFLRDQVVPSLWDQIQGPTFVTRLESRIRNLGTKKRSATK